MAETGSYSARIKYKFNAKLRRHMWTMKEFRGPFHLID